jgi:hypothetical protein
VSAAAKLEFAYGKGKLRAAVAFDGLLRKAGAKARVAAIPHAGFILPVQRKIAEVAPYDTRET